MPELCATPHSSGAPALAGQPNGEPSPRHHHRPGVAHRGRTLAAGGWDTCTCPAYGRPPIPHTHTATPPHTHRPESLGPLSPGPVRYVVPHCPLSILSLTTLPLVPTPPLTQVPNWDAGTWTGLTLPQAMWGSDQVALKPADYGSTTVQYSQGVFGAQLNL